MSVSFDNFMADNFRDHHKFYRVIGLTGYVAEYPPRYTIGTTSAYRSWKKAVAVSARKLAKCGKSFALATLSNQYPVVLIGGDSKEAVMKVHVLDQDGTIDNEAMYSGGTCYRIARLYMDCTYTEYDRERDD